MSKLFWLAMGVTIGGLAVRKLSRAAARLTPQGIAQGLGAGLVNLGESVRDFAVDVREAMAERESELREAAGMDGRIGQETQPAAHRR